MMKELKMRRCARVMARQTKATRATRARANMVRDQSPKGKELAGNEAQIITNATAQKVLEKAKDRSTQLHGRLGTLHLHGPFPFHRSGELGFPDQEKAAEARERARKVEDANREMQCKWIQTLDILASITTATITTHITPNSTVICACWSASTPTVIWIC